MCTLAIYFHTSARHPVVVAANRDEFYARPALPPACLAAEPWVIGGHDVTGGGTWLGVNEHGVLAGILNRRTPTLPDPAKRSRGLLCLDVLRQRSVAAASALVCREPGGAYNPFNLLIASADAACVIGNVSGRMIVTQLDPGLHLLSNLELNDPECSRIAKSYRLFEAAGRGLDGARPERILARLRTILSDHSTPLDPRSAGPPNNLCVHTERFGTRSSSVLIYVAQERRFRMWHANGPPCQTAYTEVELVGDSIP